MGQGDQTDSLRAPSHSPGELPLAVLLPAHARAVKRTLPIAGLLTVPSEEEFVVGVHHQLLGRIPTASQIEAMMAPLKHGKQRHSIVYETYASPERAIRLGRGDWSPIERYMWASNELLSELKVSADARVVATVTCALIRAKEPDPFGLIRAFVDRAKTPSRKVAVKLLVKQAASTPQQTLRFAVGIVEGNARWADLRLKLERPASTPTLEPLVEEIRALRLEHNRLENRLIEVSTRLRHIDGVVRPNSSPKAPSDSHD